MIVPKLPTGGHWTRDVAFSKDGTRMFVSVETAVNTVVLNHIPARKARKVFIFWLQEIWLEQLK